MERWNVQPVVSQIAPAVGVQKAENHTGLAKDLRGCNGSRRLSAQVYLLSLFFLTELISVPVSTTSHACGKQTLAPAGIMMILSQVQESHSPYPSSI